MITALKLLCKVLHKKLKIYFYIYKIHILYTTVLLLILYQGLKGKHHRFVFQYFTLFLPQLRPSPHGHGYFYNGEFFHAVQPFVHTTPQYQGTETEHI